MRVNIHEYRFTKAEVRELIPTLSDRIFKNWSEDGLIELRVKGKTRLLSALGVIKLAAMHEAVSFGVRPLAAKDLAEKVAPRVLELWAALPQFPEGAQRQSLVLPTDRETPIFYAVFEVDLLAGIMFERILRHVGVLPSPKRKPAAKKGRRK